MQSVLARPVAVPQFPRRSAGASGLALFALGLALLTGLTVGQLTLLGGRSFEKQPAGSTEATRTGMEFYDAIGIYLATGQTGEIQRMVHPEFIDHVDGQPATSGLEPLVRELDTLRAFVSEERFTATPISQSGELVRFAVSIPPRADATIFGLPVNRTEVFAFSDTLRIVDGRVTERWSDLQLPVTSTTLASTAWDPPPASQMLPAIKRITALIGSTMTLQLGTAHVILVESGALTISELPRAAASNLPEFASDSTELADPEPFVALPGSVMIAGDSPYRITNEGPKVATALLIRIAGYTLNTDLPTFGGTGTSHNDVGVQIDTLSVANALQHRKGDWTIEIGRATLAPGTTIPAHEVAGSELIVVEQGALDADLGACAQRCVQTIESAVSIAKEQIPFRAGEGISASDGATPAYRVAGSAPATLLIVTVAPAK